MQSKLQQRVDAAWPSIEKQVKEALGKAADRALRTALDVVDVDPPSPVLVRDVTSAPTGTDQCGDGSVVDSSFSANLICLRHRRYSLPLSEIELEMLKASPSSSDATASNKIRDWAKAVLGREGRLVVEALVNAAARRVTGPVKPEVVKEACQQMDDAGHPNATSSPLRLVSAGPVKTAKHKDLRPALHGGTIVEVPVDKPPASDALGVVLDPAAVELTVYQALDLELAWVPTAAGGGVDVFLDQRVSPLDLPDCSIAIVKIIADEPC